MKKLFSKIPAKVIVSVAAFALFLGNSVTTFSMYPLWHYEPELPDALKAQLQD